MGITLPLDKMTIAEKLEVLDLVWNDLSQNPENISSPEWHGEELQVREDAIQNGKDSFTDWDEAKQKILNSLL